MKVKEKKIKKFSVKEYLDTIRPYLSAIINSHKTQGKWKAHSGNTVIDYKTQGEWKIQLIFHDSTKLNIDWRKITTFFKQRVSIILWSFPS